jgi:hypothetical protein
MTSGDDTLETRLAAAKIVYGIMDVGLLLG